MPRRDSLLRSELLLSLAFDEGGVLRPGSCPPGVVIPGGRGKPGGSNPAGRSPLCKPCKAKGGAKGLRNIKLGIPFNPACAPLPKPGWGILRGVDIEEGVLDPEEGTGAVVRLRF